MQKLFLHRDRCGDVNVCCRMDPSSTSLRTDPPPRTSDNRQSDFICVPFWECLNYTLATEASSEEGLIDIRGYECNPPDLWCPTSNTRVRRNDDEQECGIKGNSASDDELQSLPSMGSGIDIIRTNENSTYLSI